MTVKQTRILKFKCSVVEKDELEVVMDRDGELGFLINDESEVCIGEVCLDREGAIQLRDWITKGLRETKP